MKMYNYKVKITDSFGSSWEYDVPTDGSCSVHGVIEAVNEYTKHGYFDMKGFDPEIDRSKSDSDKIGILEDQVMELLKWKDCMEIEHDG